MKLKMFCVYDSKAEAFMQPFFMNSTGEAVRSWQDVVNDPKTQFNKHPADFTLFELGEYDDSSGSIAMHNAKIPLGTALEHKIEQNIPKLSPINSHELSTRQ